MDASSQPPSAAPPVEEWVVKVLAVERMTVSRSRERVVAPPVRKRRSAATNGKWAATVITLERLAFGTAQGWLATAPALKGLGASPREWLATVLALERWVVARAVERIVVVLTEEWTVMLLAAGAAWGAVTPSPVPTTTSPNPRMAMQNLPGCRI